MIDVRRMRALQELSQRGTVAAAADALHLTPSAVSQQLAALERDVGQRLLEPAGRGVRLTPAAQLLVDHASALFAQLERLHADLDAHANGTQGTVRVAGFATALSELVAPAVARIAAAGSGVKLVVSEAEAPEVFDLLSAHSIDIALGIEGGHAPGHNDPRFARVELLQDVMDVALPRSHRLAEAESIRLQDLSTEAWVAPPAGWQCESVTIGACRSAGFSPNAVHRTSAWSTALRLVGAGLGVALIPRLALAEVPPGVVLRSLAGTPPRRHIFAACRSGHEEAPVIRLVLGALSEAALEATTRGARAAQLDLVA